MHPFTVLLIFVVTTVLIGTSPITSSYYWKNRELKCVYYGGNNTRCTLVESEDSVEQNPGCFEELDNTDVTRIYCGLNCEESEETTIVSKKPQWSHQCSMFYSYNLERRRKDWYLWRSKACINTTISFKISCGTHSDPKIFYYRNANLFEYEDTE